jgi:glycosyltransferase involved in cell wall biosynthesis
VIATYAADEPIAAIFEAAAQAGPEFGFDITGNPARLDQQLRSRAPANIRFTGFLEEAAFWSLLRDSHVVMDLTLAENCLVCGAYESLAIGTPMILSGSPASQELFGPSACYSDNSPGSIVTALHDARSRLEELRSAAPGVRERMNRDWQQQAAALQAEMSRLIGSGAAARG